MMSLKSALAVLAFVGMPFSTTPASARGAGEGVGDAIVPAFHLEHHVLEPGQRVVLSACVTNDNPHSTRLVVPGDSLTFRFTSGDVAACLSASAISVSGGLRDGHVTCSTAVNV